MPRAAISIVAFERNFGLDCKSFKYECKIHAQAGFENAFNGSPFYGLIHKTLILHFSKI